MQIVSNIALISINETVIVQLISFLIFLFIINRLMFRPLRKVMRERDDYIKRMRHEIVDSEKELTRYTRQIEKRKEEVKTQAFEATKELETHGRIKANEMIRAAETEIATLRDNALKEINVQIAEARKETKAQAEKLTVSIMERVLERRLAS